MIFSYCVDWNDWSFPYMLSSFTHNFLWNDVVVSYEPY